MFPGQFNSDPTGRVPFNYSIPSNLSLGITASLTGGTASNQGLVTISVPGTYLITYGVSVYRTGPTGSPGGGGAPAGLTGSSALMALRMAGSLTGLTPIAGSYILVSGNSNAGGEFLPENTLITSTFIVKVVTAPMVLDIANANQTPATGDGTNGAIYLDSQYPAITSSAILTIACDSALKEFIKTC